MRWANADEIYVVWDKRLEWPSTNFREQSQYVDYKADRDSETIKIMFNHVNMIEQVLQFLGIKNMYPKVMEADDVISWLSTKLLEQKTIISADADMYQLVTNETVVYNPIKKMLVTVENFQEKIGIEKKGFILFKAIQGDPSDNIKGLHGYGPVKAKKLVNELLTGKMSLTEEQMFTIKHNLTLIDLSKGYLIHPGEINSYEEQFNRLQTQQPDFEKFRLNCIENGFDSILKHFDDWKSIFMNDNIKTKQLRINHDR